MLYLLSTSFSAVLVSVFTTFFFHQPSFSRRIIQNNPSFNECLHSGTCLLPLIFDILLRFKVGNMGLVSGIKQAFLNIEIDEAQWNFLRFLLVGNILEKDKIVVYRFSRVVFRVTSSLFLLGATIKSHVTTFAAQIAVAAL